MKSGRPVFHQPFQTQSFWCRSSLAWKPALDYLYSLNYSQLFPLELKRKASISASGPQVRQSIHQQSQDCGGYQLFIPDWEGGHLTLIACFLLKRFRSWFFILFTYFFFVSPSRRVTVFAGIVTGFSRMRALYYHISTRESHIISRIYPHLLVKALIF